MGSTTYVYADRGNYTLSGIINDPGDNLVGLNGRPNLNFSSGGLFVSDAGAVGLNITNTTTSDSVFVLQSGGTATRIFARSSSGLPCFLNSSTLTDSVCWAGPASFYSGQTNDSNSLRNDDFIGGSSGALSLDAQHLAPTTYSDTLVNVVARAGAGPVDIAACSDGTSSIQVDVTHSNFATKTVSASGCTAADAQISTDATDQSSAPQFVNAAAGNFHELSSSPTINAGLTDGANGALDLDGNPRSIAGRTDIGAYELGGPVITPLAPPHGTRITHSSVKKKKHTASLRFTASGTVTGFRCALARKKKGRTLRFVFHSCSSPKKYKHLKHGRYTFEVRAFNSAGVDPTPATKTFRL